MAAGACGGREAGKSLFEGQTNSHISTNSKKKIHYIRPRDDSFYEGQRRHIDAETRGFEIAKKKRATTSEGAAAGSGAKGGAKNLTSRVRLTLTSVQITRKRFITYAAETTPPLRPIGHEISHKSGCPDLPNQTEKKLRPKKKKMQIIFLSKKLKQMMMV